MKPRNKKWFDKRHWLGIFGIIVFSSSLLFSTGVFAEGEGPPAPAIPAVGPMDDQGAGASRVSESILGNIWAGVAQGGTAAMLGFLQYMGQKVAYDTATYLSNPNMRIFDGSHWTNIVKDYGNEAASKALDELSRNTLGFGICEPPNLSANLNLLLGLQKVGKPELKCKFDLFAKGGQAPALLGAVGKRGMQSTNQNVIVNQEGRPNVAQHFLKACLTLIRLKPVLRQMLQFPLDLYGFQQKNLICFRQ